MPSVSTYGKRRQARRIASTSLAAVAVVGLTATAGHAEARPTDTAARHLVAAHTPTDACRKGNGTYSGPVEGVLKYKAGKLTVTEKFGGSKDTPRTEVYQLCLSAHTKVYGALRIGDAHRLTVNKEGYGTTPRTLSQLKKAARRGDVTVRADIDNNVAIKVWEHYKRG